MTQSKVFIHALVARCALSLGMLVLLCTQALAQDRPQDRGVFDIYLGNVPVGLFAYSGVEAGGQYSLAGQLRTTGLVGALTNVRYVAKSKGRVVAGRFVPSLYEEDATIGTRNTTLTIRYNNGVPNTPVFDPPESPDVLRVDPSAQGDAVDVLTGLFGVFRNVAEGQACRFSSFVYDGTRRTSMSLRLLRQSADEAVCAGQYRRIGGFTQDDLERRAVFDFRLVYAPREAGGWQVSRADVETIYGVVRLERRDAP